MTATSVELEARVAALEASQADYRAVLTAVNMLSVQTAERFEQVDRKIDAVEQRLGAKVDDTNARVRSIEEHLAEMKDLIVQGFERGPA
ncbi:hypothetical protein [Skermania piniformis]|uniref:Uncharacterized protein n=1 Tax=Skermania pinensis TaxID=39122 RepID=A0ABX8S8F6_9ACTN|nr:hypothetical protein [Skermania piniformis]QXQ14092.1 hypothetical protein KV203_01120 [Skermania piniformis]